MNATPGHLKEDIRRLVHPDAHVEQGFVVHLYRLSPPGKPFSGRDWTASHGGIVSLEDVVNLSQGASMGIYYGMVGATGEYDRGLWRIQDRSKELLASA